MVKRAGRVLGKCNMKEGEDERQKGTKDDGDDGEKHESRSPSRRVQIKVPWHQPCSHAARGSPLLNSHGGGDKHRIYMSPRVNGE